MIQERGRSTFYANPQLGIAPVVKEFHFYLQFWVGTTVYVGDKWVDFSAATINIVHNLVDDDSEAYKALF